MSNNVNNIRTTIDELFLDVTGKFKHQPYAQRRLIDTIRQIRNRTEGIQDDYLESQLLKVDEKINLHFKSKNFKERHERVLRREARD